MGLTADGSDWCAANQGFCPHIYWCGAVPFAAWTATGVAIFQLLYHVLAHCVYPLVQNLLKKIPSKYDNEESCYWFAWHAQSVIHDFIVVGLALGPVLRLMDDSPQNQIGSPSDPASYADHTKCASGAHVFLCFVISDIFVVSMYKIEKGAMLVQMLIHHGVFVSFVTIVTYNCFFGYLAGWMLLMELSTLFLNYFSFFRNRLGYGNLSVSVSYTLFALCYVFLRLIAMTYVVGLFGASLWTGSVDYTYVPMWHQGFIFVGLLASLAMQCNWAIAGVCPKLRKVTAASRQGDDGRSALLSADRHDETS